MSVANYSAGLEQLTDDENQMLRLIMTGDLNKQIAFKLDRSVRCIEDRRARIMNKLGVTTLVGLIRLAIEAGM